VIGELLNDLKTPSGLWNHKQNNTKKKNQGRGWSGKGREERMPTDAESEEGMLEVRTDHNRG